MKTLLKVLYGFVALALGIFFSVALIKAVVSHDAPHETEVLSDSRFPDYVVQLNKYYESFQNKRGHFHQTQERVFLPMKDQENCLNCHSLWPHTKDQRTRSFNNQHSRYMSCLVCHIDDQRGRRVNLEWTNFGVDNSLTRQGPFGVNRLAEDKLSGSENFITKIVPLIIDGSIKTRLFTPYNTPAYVEYRESVDAGRYVDEAKMRVEAEALVGEKAATCSVCHSEAGTFPWTTLGFTGDRLNEMQHSAVVGMVEKYDSFYFPPVFE
ncbi:MAG: hypothetical protein HQ508_03790 [Candidatus Marinimicrobia bacterium]|nr:hypothetical protein [Candidatus Neomarinimicrobiota bacterium]